MLVFPTHRPSKIQSHTIQQYLKWDFSYKANVLGESFGVQGGLFNVLQIASITLLLIYHLKDQPQLHSSFFILFFNINSKHRIRIRKQRWAVKRWAVNPIWLEEARFYYQDAQCRMFLGVKWRSVHISPLNTFSNPLVSAPNCSLGLNSSVLKLNVRWTSDAW